MSSSEGCRERATAGIGGGTDYRAVEAWSDGDEQAFERLTPLVYPELRRIALRYLQRERVGHTLQPMALVHEAYLRLVDARMAQWQDRAHFFAVLAQTMRRMLVSAARTRSAGSAAAAGSEWSGTTRS